METTILIQNNLIIAAPGDYSCSQVRIMNLFVLTKSGGLWVGEVGGHFNPHSPSINSFCVIHSMLLLLVVVHLLRWNQRYNYWRALCNSESALTTGTGA